MQLITPRFKPDYVRDACMQSPAHSESKTKFLKDIHSILCFYRSLLGDVRSDLYRSILLPTTPVLRAYFEAAFEAQRCQTCRQGSACDWGLVGDRIGDCSGVSTGRSQGFRRNASPGESTRKHREDKVSPAAHRLQLAKKSMQAG